MAFSTNGAPGSDRLSSEINVAPLIDVLLVMLIIFMVIVPVMPRGLNTALPATASAGDEAPDSPILVEVEQGAVTVRYRINGIEVEKTRIAPGLAELVSRRPSRRMVLKADAKLDFAVIAGGDRRGSGCWGGKHRIVDSRSGRTVQIGMLKAC